VKLFFALVSAILAAVCSLPAFSQGGRSDWSALSAEAKSLLEKRQEKRVATIARKALALAQEKRGPEHRDVATSLMTLADILESMGELAGGGVGPAGRAATPRGPSRRASARW
jgi:hypothetical protein